MKNAARNWKTTLAGIIALLTAGLQIYHNPASVTDPGVTGAIAGGVGLILAKDSATNGTAAKP